MSNLYIYFDNLILKESYFNIVVTGQVSKLQTKILNVTAEQEEVIPKHIRGKCF